MEHEVVVNPGYAHDQLARSLRSLASHADPAVRARAAERVRRWESVIRGLAEGSLAIGSRTPVAGVPAWVTLEVAHGGFATGRLLAGGPLQPHEGPLLESLGRPAAPAWRQALNLHFLSDAGLRELGGLLASGRYRVDVPEEGALLVVAWLLGRGEVERAHEVIEAIMPLFDRLRFYPRPDPRPLAPSAVVRIESAAEVRARLAALRVPREVAAMNEALSVWAPMTDRIVALFLETVREDMSMGSGAPGAPAGWPCAVYPAGWRERALAWQAEYAELRRRHPLCGKPDDPKENLARLRGYLARVLGDPASLRGRDVGAIRRILGAHVAKYGAPGSSAAAERRAAEAARAARPTHERLARALAQRLVGVQGDAGVPSLEEVTGAIAADEAAAHGLPAGTAIPEALQARLARCLEAPVEDLVARGVIRSSEALARTLPQITAQVGAAAFEDADLRALHAAIYAAFRRRRSLLLLNLAGQVRFEELPWIAALAPLRAAKVEEKAQAQRVLEQVATLAITSFPQTIVPNKLVLELGALARAAELRLPLVEEIAADIFMGTFTEKFLAAAQIAGKQLRGSIYARYYGLPYERLLALPDVSRGHEPRAAPAFAALCTELARVGTAGRGSTARGGMILEQEQILTTHNLAPLFEALALERRVDPAELAERCLKWICRWQRSPPREWRAALQRLKNTAYALRQLLYFLSRARPEEVERFAVRAAEHVARQGEEFQRRFAPVLRGLEWVLIGGEFDAQGLVGGDPAAGRRLLGWAVGRHWWMDGARTG